MWLNHTLDGQGPFTTITKVHNWFRLVTRLLGLVDANGVAIGDAAMHSVQHIAKVDDDTFLNMPVLLNDLDGLVPCTRALYYGVFAFAGYNPMTYLKCGFDYGDRGSRYRRYGCASGGKAHGVPHPPFPFTCGSLMLSSTPLIVRLAAEPAINAFVKRSESAHNTDEDVAMGFWLSRYHLSGAVPVTYVRINEKLVNLGCFRNGGLYRPPHRSAVGMHFVKSAGGMQYIWNVIANGAKPNATLCRKMTGDGRL